MVPRCSLSPTGPAISRLVYGTWRILDDQPTPQELNRRLHRCVELGITSIDTAEIYGLYQVEAALGRAMALTPGLRDKLELVTKAGIYIPHAGNPEREVAYYDATGSQLGRSVETSLRLLGTDHLELFLVHRPDWLTGIDETAGGLNELLRQGKIRSAGVSNYSATKFAALNSRMAQPLAVNQVEFHLLHMDPIYDGTLDQCQQSQVVPMAWSPLAGGRLFAKDQAAAIRLAAVAASMSSRYNGATLEQLAYAWILAHPSRPVPIIGTNKLERIESAARAASLLLRREDWYALWGAAQGHGIP